MECLIKIINSATFVNVCQFFSALGTMGAVIISLYALLRESKVKTIITSSTLEMFSPNDCYQDKSISGYSATILNASHDKNIYLKQGLFVLAEKKDEKGNNRMMLLPIIELIKLFPHKPILGPGEDYTFFISEKHMKSILKYTKKKNIAFYFIDKFNKKYAFKIKRNDLEKKLEFIEKNRKEIISL